MNVAIYARVSSERQAEKDLSIPAQLNALHNYATQHGDRIIREFIDQAETGRTTDRLAFREMISFSQIKDSSVPVNIGLEIVTICQESGRFYHL